MSPIRTWREGAIEYGLFRHPSEGTGRRWSIRSRITGSWSVVVWGHTRATVEARLVTVKP